MVYKLFLFMDTCGNKCDDIVESFLLSYHANKLSHSVYLRGFI